jgi:hypothetical protein
MGGGSNRRPYNFNDGAIYDIAKDKWEKIPKAPIQGRQYHTCQIYGTKLLVWGGRSSVGDRAIYDTATGKWKVMVYGPGGRDAPCSKIYGSKLLIWGGRVGTTFFRDGAIYDMEKDEWEEMPEAPIDGRFWFTPIFSESKLIIWGDQAESQNSTTEPFTT